jgi:anaerobic glycerol-3-phosphate dehydrogenase
MPDVSTQVRLDYTTAATDQAQNDGLRCAVISRKQTLGAFGRGIASLLADRPDDGL